MRGSDGYYSWNGKEMELEYLRGKQARGSDYHRIPIRVGVDEGKRGESKLKLTLSTVCEPRGNR